MSSSPNTTIPIHAAIFVKESVSTFFLFFLLISSSSGGSSAWGQTSSGRYSQEGPSHHFDPFKCLKEHLKCLKEHLKERGGSPGFKVPRTILQSDTWLNFRISKTLLYTYVPHYCSLLIQLKAVVESLEKVILIFSKPKSMEMVFAIRAPIRQDNNSIPGIVSSFSGGTWLLVLTNCILTLSKTRMWRMQLYSRRKTHLMLSYLSFLVVNTVYSLASEKFLLRTTILYFLQSR